MSATSPPKKLSQGIQWPCPQRERLRRHSLPLPCASEFRLIVKAVPTRLNILCGGGCSPSIYGFQSCPATSYSFVPFALDLAIQQLTSVIWDTVVGAKARGLRQPDPPKRRISGKYSPFPMLYLLLLISRAPVAYSLNQPKNIAQTSCVWLLCGCLVCYSLLLMRRCIRQTFPSTHTQTTQAWLRCLIYQMLIVAV